MNNLIDIAELSSREIEDIFELTDRIKAQPGDYSNALENATLVMLFAKPSTRTRLSFETGITQLGGHGIFFEIEASQLQRGEPIADTALVMSRYEDLIMARLFDHSAIQELAEYATVPVINGLTDLLHPCQALSDIYTLREKDRLGTIAYIGDGNNVAHSLMQICDILDISLNIATPSGYEPAEQIQQRVSDANVTVLQDPQRAVHGAQAVYTDVYVSMGEEADESETKRQHFEDYTVDKELMESAASEAVFMHCLPAHRGQEVTEDVIDGPQSIIFDQAENRLHVQKAIMYTLMTE